MTTAEAAPRRRGLPWWLWAILAVAALVGGVAAIGGFSDVPVEELPELELGTPHHGNETDTTVLGSYLTDTKPGRDFVSDDEQFLVLEAEITNISDVPTLLTRDVVRVFVDGVISGNDQPEMIDQRTGNYVHFLQPGIHLRVALVWTVENAPMRDGDELVIGVFERYRAVDDPVFDDAYTAPVPVVRILTEIGREA